MDQLADVKELYLNDHGQCRSCLSFDSVVSYREIMSGR